MEFNTIDLFFLTDGADIWADMKVAERTHIPPYFSTSCSDREPMHSQIEAGLTVTQIHDYRSGEIWKKIRMTKKRKWRKRSIERLDRWEDRIGCVC